MRRLLASTLFLVGASAIAQAQALFPHEPISGDVTTDPDTGAFGRTVAVEMTGDIDLDAVVLDGTTPVLFGAPAIHNAPLRIDVVANDIAALPDSFISGMGALLTVGPAGLVRHYYRSVNGTMHTQFLDTGDWVNARQVRVGQLDGQGKLDIIGLMSNGTTVRTYHSVLAQSWTAGPTITLSAEAFEIELGDWDGDGVLEVIATTYSGSYATLLVYELTGTFVEAVPIATTSTDGHLEVVSLSGQAAQYAAWVINDYVTPGLSWLIVAGAGAIVEDVSLGARDVAGLTTTDRDNNGHTDLVISHRSDWTLLLYVNQPDGQGPAFPINEAYLMRGAGPVTPAPDNFAAAASADFDGDGDQDLFFPLEDADAWFLFAQDTIDEGQWRPALDASYTPYSASGAVHFAMTAPASIDPQAVLQVRAWVAEGGYPNEVNDELVCEQTVNIQGAWPSTFSVSLWNPSGMYPGHLYWIEARAVTVDAQGAVTGGWAPLVLATGTGSDLLLLADRPGAGAVVTGLLSTVPPGGTGGVIEGGPTAPHSDGDIPPP